MYDFGEQLPQWVVAQEKQNIQVLLNSLADAKSQFELLNQDLELQAARSVLKSRGILTCETNVALGDLSIWQHQPTHMLFGYEYDPEWEEKEYVIRCGLNELGAGGTVALLQEEERIRDATSSNTRFYPGALQFYAWLADCLTKIPNLEFPNSIGSAEELALDIIVRDSVMPYDYRETNCDPNKEVKEALSNYIVNGVYEYIPKEIKPIRNIFSTLQQNDYPYSWGGSFMDKLICAYSYCNDLIPLPDQEFRNRNRLGSVDTQTGRISLKKAQTSNLALKEAISAGGITAAVVAALSASLIPAGTGIVLIPLNGMLILKDIRAIIEKNKSKDRLAELVRKHEIGHALSLEQGIGKARLGFVNYDLAA